MLVLTSAKMEFGVIPHDHWYQPDWIDEAKATESRNEMVANNIIYGGAYYTSLLFPCPLWHSGCTFRKRIVRLKSFTWLNCQLTNFAPPCHRLALRYRNMCRFNSGVRISLPPNVIDIWSWSDNPSSSFTVILWCRSIDGTGELSMLAPKSYPRCPRLRHGYWWPSSYRPDVHFHCDINKDPFLFMEENNKTYCTWCNIVPTVVIVKRFNWQHHSVYHHHVWVWSYHPISLEPCSRYDNSIIIGAELTWYAEFQKDHPEYIAADNTLGFISEDGEQYNLCHCTYRLFVLPRWA